MQSYPLGSPHLLAECLLFDYPMSSAAKPAKTWWKLSLLPISNHAWKKLAHCIYLNFNALWMLMHFLLAGAQKFPSNIEFMAMLVISWQMRLGLSSLTLHGLPPPTMVLYCTSFWKPIIHGQQCHSLPSTSNIQIWTTSKTFIRQYSTSSKIMPTKLTTTQMTQQIPVLIPWHLIK